MTIKKMLLLGLCVPAIALGVSACGSDDDDSSSSTGTTTAMEDTGTTDAMAAEKDIVATAQATPDLSTLVKAVGAAGLVETLQGDDPYTVFAPTNEAFEALPPAELARLLKPANKAELADILTYHVAEGDVKAADLTDGQKIDTVEGGQLTVSIDGDTVKINGAKVVTPDVATSNGTVHVIDTVLLPQQ